MNARRTPSASQSAFTLIELITVVAIIAILSSLTLATFGYVQEKAGRSRAEAEIAALSAALESYKADNGNYPAGTNITVSGDNKFLIESLMSTNAGSKVYFEFSRKMTNTGNVVDPFGASYRYQYPGGVDRSGTNFFDLWSTGKKISETNEGNWIKNW